MMKTIILPFWNVCILRQGPEHIPSYGWFVVLVTLANICVSLLVSSLASQQLDPELDVLQLATLIIVNLATQASLIWIVLYFKELSHRFVIVLTAILGCDLILTVLIGVALQISQLLFDQIQPLLLVPFQIWLFSVIGFILHRALGVTWLIGIFIGLGITFMGLVVSQTAIT